MAAACWAKYVYRMPGDEGDCWLWGGRLSEEGYGIMSASRRPGKAHGAVYSHIASWELHNRASIVPGFVVMHSCDNRWCSQPAHLSLGTQGDNIRDAARKGRMHPGSKHGLAKLTEAQVGEIRSAHAAGASQYVLADRFGVCQQNISWIINRKSWRHAS